MKNRRSTNAAILAIIHKPSPPPRKKIHSHLKCIHLNCMAGSCNEKATFMAPQFSMDSAYPFTYIPVCAEHRDNWFIEGDKDWFPEGILPPIFKIPDSPE